MRTKAFEISVWILKILLLCHKIKLGDVYSQSDKPVIIITLYSINSPYGQLSE